MCKKKRFLKCIFNSILILTPAKTHTLDLKKPTLFKTAYVTVIRKNAPLSNLAKTKK